MSTIAYAFVFASVVALIFMGVMIRRTEKKTEQRLKQARADITDMTILFQTMRDIIGQQKALARDFNEELEHKMGQVKHILSQGMEKNKQLYDKQQRIVAELEEAQAQVDGLFRQLAHLQKAALSVAPAPVLPARVERPVNPPQATPRPAQPETVTAPRQPSAIVIRTPVAAAAAEIREQSAAPAPPAARTETGLPPRASAPTPTPTALSPEEEARLADTGVTRAPFTSWIAEDLLGPQDPRDRRAPKPEPATATTPTSGHSRNPEPDYDEPAARAPGNGDAAREAFRALLNMPMSPEAPTLDMPGQTMAMAAALRGAEAEPVEPRLSAALQQRVLEYSEAGMTVAEVSRELGIGKGEVRLMLSLARQASPRQP